MFYVLVYHTPLGLRYRKFRKVAKSLRCIKGETISDQRKDSKK